MCGNAEDMTNAVMVVLVGPVVRIYAAAAMRFK